MTLNYVNLQVNQRSDYCPEMVTSGDWCLLPDVTQIFRSQSQHKGVGEPWPGDGKLIDHNICLHYDTKRATANWANFMPYSFRHYH